MPRHPRIHVPGGVYHVILRGNYCQTIFFTNGDRRRWMRLLTQGIERYQCRIHAYCWMTNHVHLAVQVSDLPLGLFVGWVASQYARATNRRLCRSGHLFQRRYRGKLVDTDQYLLQLVTYIHNNPVAAGMVDTVERYPWSSHRAYLGFYKPSFLTTKLVLNLFSENPKQAVDGYRLFMSEERQPSTELDTSVWKDDGASQDDSLDRQIEFLEEPGGSRLSLSQLIEEYCRRHNICESSLASPQRTRRNARLRAEIALAAQRYRIASLHDVANRFNRSDSALSHSIRHLLDSERAARQ